VRSGGHNRCKVCGSSVIDFDAATDLFTCTDSGLLKALAAATRQASDAKAPLHIRGAAWREIALEQIRTPVASKIDRLLVAVGRYSKFAGDWVHLSEEDYPAFNCHNDTEAAFIYDALCEGGLLEQLAGHTSFRPSAAGWRHLMPDDVGPNGTPGVCFVAMAFADEMNDAFTYGIEVAVRRAGLDPIRVDRVQQNDKIDDLIMAEIRRAQVTIADVTLHRNGVYFEAGFALGLGRTVIWCCRKNDVENTHFDTRQYSMIVWETPEELAQKLEARIRATVTIPVSQ
jgi:hypothetical protein